VLLPVGVLARRADAAAVVFAALAAAADGAGHRSVARLVGVPQATVRGWLRRARSRAGPLTAAFTVLWCALDPEPALPERPAGPLGDLIAAISGAAGAAAGRFAPLAVTPAVFATAVTHAGLLLPSFDPCSINTSRL